MEFFDIATQGGMVAVFAWFAWHMIRNNREEREKNMEMWRDYLQERNSKMEKAMTMVSENLESVQKNQDLNTKVLIKHFSRHGGDGDDIEKLVNNK